MSDRETDDTLKQAAVAQRAVAIFHASRWPGWIWGIPAAAVAIVLWLLLRALSATGTNITVVFPQAAGMSPDDTHVTYRGLNVGTLRDVHLDAGGRHVVAELNMDEAATPWLNTGTRFYLDGANPSLARPSTLKAIIAGPSIVMVPGKGDAARHFVGIVGPAPQPFDAEVTYRVAFDGAVGGLDVGAPVTLRGFTVGGVTQVALRVDAATGRVTTPVTIVLDPTRLHLHTPAPDAAGWAPLLDEVLARMVAGGLRARLTQDPPLIGAAQVELVVVPDAPAATLVAENDKRPLIPSAPAGIDPMQLLAKLDQLPIDTIAGNIRAITENVRATSERVNALVNSPRIDASLRHLDATLATLDDTTKALAPELVPTVRSLRDTAQQIDATARAAQALVDDRSGGMDGNAKKALYELTQAARAIRSLADYLEHHPNALITGR